MKYYLASNFEDRPRMLRYKEQLEYYYHEVTSQWINHPPHITANDPNVDLHDNAMMDLEDIRKADQLILFNDDHKNGRGGRWVEMGYALALAKPIILIGPKTNAFCHLRFLFQANNWATFLSWIQT